MLQVELHDIGDFRPFGRLERNGADGGCPAPLTEPLTATAATITEIIKDIRPGGVMGEGGVVGIDGKRWDVHPLDHGSGPECRAGTLKRGGNDLL